MVLIRWIGLVAAAAAAAGCSQSLFDSHGGSGGGPGSDGGDPTTCAAPCIADADKDFDGSPRGKTGRWRYLDDHRDRSWIAMTPISDLMTGVDPRNHITTCKSHPEFPACVALSDALLVTSAGSASAADPAIEFLVPESQVMQLSLRVYVKPGDDDQQILLYRNSREDVLYSGLAASGHALEQVLTLDALAKDRFLLALAPAGPGASNVGVQLIAGPSGAAFPSSCQLGAKFDAAMGTMVADACRGTQLIHFTYRAPPAVAPLPSPVVIDRGPFLEQDPGADLTPASYLLRNTGAIDWSGDVTVQFWVAMRGFESGVSTAVLFSDQDPEECGGIELTVSPSGPATTDLVLTACTAPPPALPTVASARFALGSIWQFVRVVRTVDRLDVCIDGKRVTGIAFQPGPVMKTNNPLFLGRAVSPSPDGAHFDGRLDDVRVLSAALPCQ